MQPNGNSEEKKRSLGLGHNGIVIGFVGWLLPIKGPEYLLKAMADIWPDYPTVSLVMVGKGELDVNLRAEALQKNVNGKVKFPGWREDIYEIKSIFDMLVLPSLNAGMDLVLV